MSLIKSADLGRINTFPQQKWKDVTNFFMWKDVLNSRRYFVVIGKEGELVLERADNHKKYHNKFIEYWELWRDELLKCERPIVYDYPVWFVNRSTRKKYLAFFGLQSFLVLSVVVLLLRTGISNTSEIINALDLTLFLMFVLLIGILVETVLLFITTRRGFWKLSLNGNCVRINFLNSSVKVIPVESIKKFCLRIDATNARITFDNGVSLNHLERIAHWPILREYLLSKLEPRKMNGDK